ncbi:unnamed protein product [Acidithrix sp. C25]|nr:unnamed protein product [Acidithrix sp. C25]
MAKCGQRAIERGCCQSYGVFAGEGLLKNKVTLAGLHLMVQN